MINSIKRTVFYWYVLYEAYFPLHVGKYRAARLLNTLFGLAVYDIEGFKIGLNPVAAIDRALILGLKHDVEIVQRINQIPADKSFVDIGANIGYFSLYAASQGVRSYAFEPSPREIARLRCNIEMNGFTNIKLFEAGISDKRESLPLKLGMDYNPGQNSVLSVSASRDSVPCNFAPLDDFLSPQEFTGIGLVKIDVEGFELSVLRGMEASMDAMACPFVVEITPAFFAKAGHRAQDIYDLFERHGYRPLYGLDEDARRYDEVFNKDLSAR